VPRNNTQIEIKEKNFLCNRKHVQLAVAWLQNYGDLINLLNFPQNDSFSIAKGVI
jgi:hypothetical protein